MSTSLRILAAAGIAVGAMGVGVTYADIPDANNVFTACVTKSSGAVRMINVEKTPKPRCKDSEKKVRWNQYGQRGPRGTDGVSGYEVVVQQQSYGAESGGVTSNFSALCPAGKNVIGGGASAKTEEGSTTSVYVVTAHGPTGAGGAGWEATFDIDNSGLMEPYVLKVYAICAVVQ